MKKGIAFAWLFTQVLFSQGASDTVLTVGSQAPGFYLKMLGGEEFFSRDYFGKPRETNKAPTERYHTVISFFATYCVPCKKEIPELEKLQEKFPGVKFFLVDVNEKKEKVDEHLKTTPIKLPIVLDRYGKVSEMYKLKGEGNVVVLPSLVMITKDGFIHAYKKGYHDGDETKIEAEIKRMTGDTTGFKK